MKLIKILTLVMLMFSSFYSFADELTPAETAARDCGDGIVGGNRTVNGEVDPAPTPAETPVDGSGTIVN